MRLRPKSRAAVLIMVIGAALITWASKEESLDELKARADNARTEDRPALCIEVAEHELKSADQLYRSGDLDKARAAVAVVVDYSQQAFDASTQTGKRLKKTEIALRKIAEKLRDIKETLNFADQAPVQTAADKLEKMRTDLLSQMFPRDHK